MTERRTIDSSLDLSRVEELCRLRFEVIKQVERDFQRTPNVEDAKFLRDSWKRWKDGNWGSYIDGEVPTKEDVEDRIKKYSAYFEGNQ